MDTMPAKRKRASPSDTRETRMDPELGPLLSVLTQDQIGNLSVYNLNLLKVDFTRPSSSRRIIQTGIRGNGEDPPYSHIAPTEDPKDAFKSIRALSLPL